MISPARSVGELVDRVVPAALLQDPETALRARVVALVSVILSFAALPAVPTLLVATDAGDPRVLISMLGGSLQALVLLALMRGAPLAFVARAQLMVLTGALMLIFAIEGGLPGSSGPWVMLVPGFAVLTRGPRSGWFWTALLSSGVAGVTVWVLISQPPEVARQAVLQGGSLMLALPALTAWVAYFENARLDAIRTSARAVAELEARNREATDARDLAIEAGQARSEFLARTSHELRTPMTAVLGMLDLLLDGDLAHEEHEQAETARDSARALLTVLDDILDLGRLDAGKVRIDRRSFDPRGPVEGAVALAASVARSRDLQLSCFIGPAVPARMEGDPDRVRQVVLNLVANAVRYTDEGEVAVRTSLVEVEGEAALRVEVSDTGVGIDLDATPRTTLFRAFEQGERFASRSHEGVGLGLAIASQLVTLMGGTLDLESELGHGSRFWFTVPFGADPGPPPEPPPEIDGMRILVVQEHRTARDMMVSTLRDWGSVVEGAAPTPELAAQLAASCTCDLIVLDLDHAVSTCSLPALRDCENLRETPILGFAPVNRRPRRSSLPPGPTEILSSPPRHAALRRSFTRLLKPQETEMSELYRTGESRLAALPRGEGRILVVEDNPTAGLIARRFLERLGYEAVLVTDGTSGLEAAGERFDLILMDCQLPGITGYEVAESIRAGDGPNRDTPIIAVTAHAQADEHQRCRDAGMNECVVKPYEPEVLAAQVARFLEPASNIHSGPSQSPGTT